MEKCGTLFPKHLDPGINQILNLQSFLTTSINISHSALNTPVCDMGGIHEWFMICVQ